MEAIGATVILLLVIAMMVVLGLQNKALADPTRSAPEDESQAPASWLNIAVGTALVAVVLTSFSIVILQSRPIGSPDQLPVAAPPLASTEPVVTAHPTFLSPPPPDLRLVDVAINSTTIDRMAPLRVSGTLLRVVGDVNLYLVLGSSTMAVQSSNVCTADKGDFQCSAGVPDRTITQVSLVVAGPDGMKVLDSVSAGGGSQRNLPSQSRVLKKFDLLPA